MLGIDKVSPLLASIFFDGGQGSSGSGNEVPRAVPSSGVCNVILPALKEVIWLCVRGAI
jgi:hypothetical protein